MFMDGKNQQHKIKGANTLTSNSPTRMECLRESCVCTVDNERLFHSRVVLIVKSEKQPSFFQESISELGIFIQWNNLQ